MTVLNMLQLGTKYGDIWGLMSYLCSKAFSGNWQSSTSSGAKATYLENFQKCRLMNVAES